MLFHIVIIAGSCEVSSVIELEGEGSIFLVTFWPFSDN